jgi:hypothetical protein
MVLESLKYREVLYHEFLFPKGPSPQKSKRKKTLYSFLRIERSLQFRVRSVAKRRIPGMAAITDHQPFGLAHDIFFGGLSGLFGFMGTVTVRFIRGLAAGTVVFDAFAFIDKLR